MSKKKRRRGADNPRVPDVPDHLFTPIANRIDRLIRYHGAKWPFGINPEKSVHDIAKQIAPAARAYKAGVRARNLYDLMLKIEAWLSAGVDVDVEETDAH